MTAEADWFTTFPLYITEIWPAEALFCQDDCLQMEGFTGRTMLATGCVPPN